MNEKEIQKLLCPEAFPHKVKNLRLKETYISWLIFTGNFVYKIKKPVKYSYLDFSTINKRKFFCKEELKLNRRLSPEIYLDVVPILKAGRKLKILKSSKAPLTKEKILDWTLKMKEIPQKYSLKELVKKGKIREREIQKIAKKIFYFHQMAQTSPEIDEYGKIKLIKKNWEENFEQTKPFLREILNENLYSFIKKEIENFLKKEKLLFLKRIKEKKIKDTHGDLHSENIFVTPKGIYIIDCVEFTKRFRYQDIVSDIAFLAMDLDFLERKDLSEFFVQKYNFYLNDKDLFKILPFYKCYRAYIRAKVGCLSLPKADLFSIQKYFSLAFKYAFELSKRKPLLLVIFGQIGTGKTYLAKHLANTIGAKLLRSDIIRKKMLGIPLFSHPKKNLEKIYSQKVTYKVYQKMLSEGLKAWKKGEFVILDATFSKEFYRKKVIEMTKKEKVPYFFIQCHASEKKILERLKEREKKERNF